MEKWCQSKARGAAPLICSTATPSFALPAATTSNVVSAMTTGWVADSAIWVSSCSTTAAYRSLSKTARIYGCQPPWRRRACNTPPRSCPNGWAAHRAARRSARTSPSDARAPPLASEIIFCDTRRKSMRSSPSKRQPWARVRNTAPALVRAIAPTTSVSHKLKSCYVPAGFAQIGHSGPRPGS